MIPPERYNLYEYVTKVRHGKSTNRVYVPDYIIGGLIDYARAARISLLDPNGLVMFGVFTPLYYEHALAWVWLCQNLPLYMEGLERGVITYSPN